MSTLEIKKNKINYFNSPLLSPNDDKKEKEKELPSIIIKGSNISKSNPTSSREYLKMLNSNYIMPPIINNNDLKLLQVKSRKNLSNSLFFSR